MRSLVLSMASALLCLVAGCTSSSSARADAGRSCEQLANDFLAARSAASACTPGASNQCQATVPVTLCAGCNWYVNDASQVQPIVAQFFAQGCDKNGATACTFYNCIQVAPFTCVANDGGAPGGTCTLP
jgi:hypothetical protein